MAKLVSIALVLLLTASGCCGARLHDPCFTACQPDICQQGSPRCSLGVGNRLRNLWASHRSEPPAPVPPPHPKYHPVPTRPVFAPLPY